MPTPQPPADSLTVGTHVEHLPGKRAAKADEIMKAVDNTLLEPVLRRHPLGEVKVVSKLMNENSEPVAGLYLYDGRKVFINRSAEPAAYNQKFKPNRMSPVAEAAATPLDYQQRAFVHEMGHHLYGILSKTLQDRVYKDYVTVATAGQTITAYAMTHEREYLSESLAAYIDHCDDLKEYDRIGFDLVEAALAEAAPKGG